MRVLHIGKFYPPHVGGIETHLQSLCEGLRGFSDVRVIVASDHRQTVRGDVSGIDVTRCGTLVSFAAAPVCPSMVSEIRRADADIVHLHQPHPTGMLAYLASGHKAHAVVTYHSDIVRQKLLGRAFKPFLNNVLHRSSAIIVSSPNYLATSPYLQQYRDRCRVIPFGIPLEQFQRCDESRVAGLHEKYGRRLIVCVGRLVYYKGFEYLIRAMQWVDARLVVIGDGALRQRLLNERNALGLESRVEFISKIPREEIISFYHAAAVFVLPSIARSEAFGIVQIEAMATGCPVINTNLDSGVPYVSLDGVTGLTVPPRDARKLASAINAVLDNDELRRRFGNAARERAHREFNQQRMVERTLEVYEQVLSAESAPTILSLR